MIVGGATPAGVALTLDAVAECVSPGWLVRRGAVLVNLGGEAAVEAGRALLFAPTGAMVRLSTGLGPVTLHPPRRFCILSAPAHVAHPARVVAAVERAARRIAEGGALAAAAAVG